MKIKLIKIKVKKILTKTNFSGYDWLLDQYVGCQHACNYCYARFISTIKPNYYGKWGEWVEAKINAPNLVKGRQIKGWVYMSSISDPYIPIEKKLKLTRNILKNLDKRIKLSIQTRSDLILRDIDLFKKFKNIHIGLTINDFKVNQKKIFEPFSPSNEKRIKTLKVLKNNNIKTFVSISPIVPGLIDFKKIIKKTKSFTDYYWFGFLNIRNADQDFTKKLKMKFPESYKILINEKKFQKFIKDSKKIILAEGVTFEKNGIKKNVANFKKIAKIKNNFTDFKRLDKKEFQLCFRGEIKNNTKI
jgi:DNA repair photolyase